MSGVAECIAKVGNWSKVQSVHMFDKPNAFMSEMVNSQIEEASPKLTALLKKIQECDAEDMRKEGHLFKHMIFSGNPATYGAKIVVSALIASGFTPAFTATAKGKLHNINDLSGSDDHKNFTMLLSKPVYGNPLTVNFKKHALEQFNKRPDNIYGQQIRFIVLDGGFREGIDLFDIKYIHLLEPTPITADERQAIGRGTRFCGQKGLKFHPKRGWPLHVFKYEVDIPSHLQSTFQGAKTFLELQLKYSDIDLRKVTLAAELDNISVEAAVDTMLTKPIHEFNIRGGSEAPGLALYDRVPNKIMNHKAMRLFINKYYLPFMYPKVKLENGCGGPNKSVSVTGGAQIAATFNPTQDFIRTFFQPASAYKGMLLYHSVGTGKTCTGIAVASSSFEKQGYTILWVTRHTLKADIAKNLYGNVVCSVPMQELLAQGKKISKADLSSSWIQPISYKQFSNMLLKKNKTYQEMVTRNGTEDPLHKTLIIIDEAHKLYAPNTPAAEKPNTAILEKMIRNSYEKSEGDSVRLILMTGTPYTESPMEMIKLLNLLKDYDIPNTFEEFSKEYLDETGHFTAEGRTKFLDDTAGYISYINRSSDARNFAYPILHNVNVTMTLPKEQTDVKKNKFKANINALKQKLKQGKANAKECVAKAKEELVDAKHIFAKKKAEALEQKKDNVEACEELPRAERADCKKEAKNMYDAEVSNLTQILQDAQSRIESRKEDCIKNVSIENIEAEIKNETEKYEAVLARKKKINEEINDLLLKINKLKAEVLKLKKTKKGRDNNAEIAEKTGEIKLLSQKVQRLRMMLQLISIEVGTKLPPDMSQHTAINSRCFNERDQGSRSHSAQNDPPGRANRDPNASPSINEFMRLFQKGYNENKDAGAKKEYRKLTLMYHPDKHQNEKERYERIFKKLGSAWERFKTMRNIVGGDN